MEDEDKDKDARAFIFFLDSTDLTKIVWWMNAYSSKCVLVQ